MEQKTKIWLSDFLILNFGTLLTAIGSYFLNFQITFLPVASPVFRSCLPTTTRS